LKTEGASAPVYGIGGPKIGRPHALGVLRAARCHGSADVLADRQIRGVIEHERRVVVMTLVPAPANRLVRTWLNASEKRSFSRF
jgi:hypothetical protein